MKKTLTKKQREKLYEKQYKTAVKYAISQRIKVVEQENFTQDACFTYNIFIGERTRINNKVITINKSLKFEKRFYLFLHELGHYHIMTKLNKKNRLNKALGFESRAWNLFHSKNNLPLQSLQGLLFMLDDEFEAWKEAEKIAAKRKWHIRELAFMKLKNEFLKTYIDFIAATKKSDNSIT